MVSLFLFVSLCLWTNNFHVYPLQMGLMGPARLPDLLINTSLPPHLLLPHFHFLPTTWPGIIRCSTCPLYHWEKINSLPPQLLLPHFHFLCTTTNLFQFAWDINQFPKFPLSLSSPSLKYVTFCPETLKYATFCRETLKYCICRECRKNLNIRFKRK